MTNHYSGCLQKYSWTLFYKMYFIYRNKQAHLIYERSVVLNLFHEVWEWGKNGSEDAAKFILISKSNVINGVVNALLYFRPRAFHHLHLYYGGLSSCLIFQTTGKRIILLPFRQEIVLMINEPILKKSERSSKLPDQHQHRPQWSTTEGLQDSDGNFGSFERTGSFGSAH